MRKIQLLQPSLNQVNRVKKEKVSLSKREKNLRAWVALKEDTHDTDYAQKRIESERKILGRHFAPLEVKLMPIPFEARTKLMNGFIPPKGKNGFKSGPYRIGRTRTMLQYLNQVYWMDLEMRKLLVSGDLYTLSLKDARNVVFKLIRNQRKYLGLIHDQFSYSQWEIRELTKWNYLKRVTHSEKSWKRATHNYQYPGLMMSQTS